MLGNRRKSVASERTVKTCSMAPDELYRLDGSLGNRYAHRMNSPTTLSAKHKILHAAAAVVQRVGAGHLTLEAVAEEAQLSKGGLLYHFPTKRALLQGMLEHVLRQVQDRASEARDGETTEEINVSALIAAQQSQDDDERAMSRAIIAAGAEDPSLLDPAREQIEHWFGVARKEGGYSTLLLLAVEGLRLLEMLDLVELDQLELRRLYGQMTELSDVAEVGP